MVKVKPDPDGTSTILNDSVGPASLTRTSFKLQLQREQLIEAEKKDLQRSMLMAMQKQKSNFRQNQPRMIYPNISTSFSVPAPIKSLANNVPTSVLKVSDMFG